jgi:hypothetical protein
MELDRSIPRLSHTSTRVGSYLFVMGGHDGKQYSSDVLLLNLGESFVKLGPSLKNQCADCRISSNHELGDSKHSRNWTYS